MSPGCKRLTKKLMRGYRTRGRRQAIREKRDVGERGGGRERAEGRRRCRRFTQLAPELIRPTCLNTALFRERERTAILITRRDQPLLLFFSGHAARDKRRGLRKHADVGCPTWSRALSGGTEGRKPPDRRAGTRGCSRSMSGLYDYLHESPFPRPRRWARNRWR